MHKLSNATIKLISSSQVVTSVYAAVKELVENSIDAKASSIEIQLENYGLKRVQVVDNGCGIPKGEEEFVAKPHFTSKLKDHKDLASLSTYGFRGEALNSLCCVSNLSFSTKTENQSIGTLYSLDKSGNIVDKKLCTRQNGVTIICDNLFKNLPVRRQFYSCNKKGKEELRKIQDVLLAYGLVIPELRITLKHNHSIIWQKLRCSSLKDTFISAFGVSCHKYMQQGSFTDKNYDLRVTYILPKISATEEISRKTNDRIFVSINGRPVMLKDICQVIKSCCNEYVPMLQNRYPIAVLEISLPQFYLDVNVEPNKSVVLMENMDEIKELIKRHVSAFYKEQALSMEDLSAFNSVERVGQKLSSNDQVAPKCVGEIEKIHNNDMHETKDPDTVEDFDSCFRNPRKCEENSNLFIRTSSDRLLDLNGETQNLTIPQRVCNKQNLYSEFFDEAELEGEKYPKVPRLELEGTKDNLILENLHHEMSNSFQIIEESNFDTCTQNSDQKSPENFQMDSCVKTKPAKLLSHLSDENLAHAHIVDNRVICSEESIDDNDEVDSNVIEKQQLGNGGIETIARATSRADYPRGIGNVSSDKPLVRGAELEIGNTLSRSNGNKTYPSAKQLTVDQWSRGVTVDDMDNGEPLKPFRILEPIKSCTTKKNMGKRRNNRESLSIKPTKPGFVQGALCTEPSAEYVIPFDLNDMKHQIENDEPCDIEGNVNLEMVIDVIGQISPWKLWIIKLRNELYFFNSIRAFEGELFEEMMKKHIISSDLVQESILITESYMKKCSVHGSRNWEFLQNIPSERNMVSNGRNLTDDRIISNGIGIRKRKDISSNDIIFEIVKICTKIKDYGVSDLNEILDKIHEASGKEKVSSFEQYRPGKVITYFQREAARLASSSTIPLTKDEINDRVLKILSLSDQYDNILCLHGKPIFSRICTLPL